MRKGTKVGQAYVALTVDGSDINKQIADEVEGADYDRLGRDAQGRFEKGRNEIRDQARQRVLDDETSFAESIARIHQSIENKTQISNGVAKQLAQDFDNGKLKVLLKKVGESLGDDLGEGFEKKMTESVLNSLQEIRTNAALSGKGTHFTQASGDSKIFLPGPDFDRVVSDFKRVLAEETRLEEQHNTELIRLDAERWKIRNTTAKAHYKYLSDLEKGLIDVRGNTLPRGRNKDNDFGINKDFGNRVGAIFGGESRIGPLRLLGKSISGIINSIERAQEAGTKLFTDFSKGFAQAEEGASIFGKTMSGITEAGSGAGGGLAAIASSGPGAIAALGAVALAASVVVSVLSALLAVIVALAATIASALVGALAVAGGALASLLVVGGLVTTMFTNLSDAQKKVLGTSFKPVVETFRGLGQILAKPIFAGKDSPVERWANNLVKALQILGPLASVMGKAFASAGTIITASLSGPGFQNFYNALGRDLPGIVNGLSRAFGNFLNGALGFFSVLTPYVLQFSNYLADLGARFSNFANSAEGQNKIADFVDRALVSLHSLLDFVGAVGGVLNKLLFSPQAQGAGNSIFDDMTAGLRRFISYLTPERLQYFFDEGRKFAKALGSTIRAVGLALAALNNTGIISGIANVATFAEKAAEAFRGLPGPIRALINPINVVKLAFLAMFGPLLEGIGQTAQAMGGFLDVTADAIRKLAGIPKFGDKFKGMADGIQAAADKTTAFGQSVADIPKNVLLSIDVNTDPAVAGMKGLLAAIRSIKITLPVHVPFKSPTKLPGTKGALIDDLLSKGPIKNETSVPQVSDIGYSHSGGSGGGGGGGKGGSGAVKKSAAEIRAAMLDIYKSLRKGLTEVSKAANPAEVRTKLTDMIASMRSAGKELDKLARKRIAATAVILNAQKKLTAKNVTALLAGQSVKGATLTDYASAREKLALKITAANQKLADAISLRDTYKTTVTEAVKNFGALTTAVAQTIDGVEQALTANDITSNLQSRLDKIRSFQENLRILLAQGLSNSAYKQIVDAGVEDGGAYAQALIAGGIGSVQQVNSLVGQIDSVAASLGQQTSDRLYQAGVSAAQGLVDGLTSLSAQLDSAAVALGNTIANAVKRSLGIKSPSRVMFDAMGYVGDGLAQGLDSQHVKVGLASSRLASQIAVSPEVAAYASKQGQTPVSGNSDQPLVGVLNVHTPTEDPMAVAHEVLNEMTGRL